MKLGLSAACLVSAALATAMPSYAETTPAPQATPAAKPPKEKKICRTEEDLGSIIPKRICKTQAQIDQEREQGTAALERTRQLQRGGGVTPGGARASGVSG